jgi:putative DNA methylase
MTALPETHRGDDHVHRSILRRIDPIQVSARARIESRNREIHLPPISVFRWWARRTEAVNGAILDALTEEAAERQLVVDPFAGGGTIGLAALARGHRVYVQDINPWAAYGLRSMLALPAAREIEDAARTLARAAAPLLERAYATTCSDGSPGNVIHTYRVAVGSCTSCGAEARLFPYALLTLLVRKERRRPEAYLACPRGHVFLGRADVPSTCPDCEISTDPHAAYTQLRTVQCQVCGQSERLQAKASVGGLRWEPVLVQRASADRLREFAPLTEHEHAQAANASWPAIADLGAIPSGRETSVLLRHGFRRWNELYPRRQQFVTHTLLDLAGQLDVPSSVADVLKLAIVGTVEFAGHLSRWDRWYLKCNDATAAHRFNFSTFVPEPHVWGIGDLGRGTVQRRLRSFVRGSDWLHKRTHRDLSVHYMTQSDRTPEIPADVTVVCGTSEAIALRDGAADVILTDPPYHDDVQYSELSLLFRAWAALPLDSLEGEAAVSHAVEVSTAASRYVTVLARIFREFRRVLRRDGRLIFSYANRDPNAWAALFRALDTAGFRAVGYAVVHSENETDYAKRHVRACTKDFVMELVPANEWPVEQWRWDADGDEGAFLRRVGYFFLQVGAFSPGWEAKLAESLSDSYFLRPSSNSTDGRA